MKPKRSCWRSRTLSQGAPAGQGPSWQRRLLPLSVLWSVVVLALTVLPGCSLLKAPRKMVDTVVPRPTCTQLAPVDLQLRIERYADHFSSQTVIALDEYVQRMGTDAARVQGLQWKLAIAGAAVTFATGPQPKANLLDLISLASLNSAAVENHWRTSPKPYALEPYLAISRSLETNAWELAASILAPAQVLELREAINEWRAKNATPGNVFAARPQEFASMVKSNQRKEMDVNSVFSLVGLDPTAGLDPAVHEITLTRLFAQRAMFAMQRMPMLLRWQAELLSFHLTDQPGVQTVLTNTTRLSESIDRMSRAAESISQTASRLPDRVTAERKAILDALERQEGSLRGLAGQVDQALVSAEKMSSSLSITITNFDALMKRFGVGEPSTNSPSDSSSAPFNILDYAQTATQIAGMARDLNTLITSANQSVPQVERLSRDATAEAQRVVDRSFRLGLVLIAVALAGSVVAGLVYRIAANKLTDRRRAPTAK